MKMQKILYKGGEGELIEKKSRFIATTRPVETEEEALAFLAEMKKKYWDATHNCSAFVIGDRQQIQRCSDDGEPQGTAGRPMLDVLLGEDIHNMAVVVTRYFGGTLLGTGGLVRAYTAAARDALEHASIRELCLCEMLEVSADYAEYEKVRRYLAQKGLAPVQTDYTDKVFLRIPVRLGELENTEREITSLTAGKCRLSRAGREYYPAS